MVEEKRNDEIFRFARMVCVCVRAEAAAIAALDEDGNTRQRKRNYYGYVHPIELTAFSCLSIEHFSGQKK